MTGSNTGSGAAPSADSTIVISARTSSHPFPPFGNSSNQKALTGDPAAFPSPNPPWMSPALMWSSEALYPVLPATRQKRSMKVTTPIARAGSKRLASAR